jgi:hypothetical protein
MHLFGHTFDRDYYFELVCTTKAYSGLGADIVMESITLKPSMTVRPAWFDTKLEQSQMVGILGLQRAHQEFKLGKPT